jgi:dihydroneopterin aldolase
MTKIGIYQIEFDAHIGTTEEERETPQPLSVDLELTCAINTTSDRLEDTIDYDAIAQAIVRIGQQNRVNLIETLADKMVEEALLDPRVLSARVRLTKCHPPFKPIRGGFVVEINRSRTASSLPD